MRRSVRAAAVAIVVAVAAPVLAPAPARADATRDAQWHLKFLNIAAAHAITQGEGVKVAVVDTGVDPSHPDLAGAVAAGTDIAVGSGDGRTDSSGHGTSMAALIAARGQPSGAGVLGIAPKATVLPVRVQRTGAIGISSKAAAGIEWAALNGAKVICVAGADPAAEPYTKALEAARKADAVVVAPSGNRPEDTGIKNPAALPGVLAVGAVDRSGNVATLSIAAPQVAVAAPGVDITTVDVGKGYRKASGTSDSTAIVAGAVALIRAKYPKLSAPEVIHRLTVTAADKGPPGRDPGYGFGVLDPVKALTAEVPPIGSSAPVAPIGSPTRGQAAPESGDGSGIGTMELLAGAICCLVGVAGLGGLLFVVLRRRRR